MQVLTQHYDNARTGANLTETVLTPDAVSGGTFGKLGELTVEGQVYAQPLYLSGVAIPNAGTRNVVYVATMHNKVYAFDADALGAPLWSVSLGPFITLPDANIGPQDYHDISDAVGVVSTPVISTDHQVLYVAAATKDDSGYHHRLHALDLTTGQEKFGGPVTIGATVPGIGSANVGGSITFTSQVQLQRPALLLANDTVYVAFASYGDSGEYHGWVFGFDAGTLQQRPQVYNTTPDGSEGGIWMAGQGPATDAAGNIYLITGNGTLSSTVLDTAGIPESALGRPALTATDGPLALAWTGTDPQHSLNVSFTADGRTETGKVTLPQFSIDGPGLAFTAGRLYIAWTGTDPAHSLNAAFSTDRQTFSAPVILPQQSPYGPALAVCNGTLYLAWADATGRLNIMQSTDGVTFGNQVSLNEWTGTAPTLAVDGSTLYLLWSGTDANHSLNVMQSTDGTTFTGPVTFADSSPFGPTLVRDGSLLRLLWAGTDGPHSLNQFAGATVQDLLTKDTFDNGAQAGPAVALLNGHPIVCWTDSAADAHLNLATLSESPQLGDAFIKLGPDLSLLDWFSPWNTQFLNDTDADLGSGGALVLPGSGLILGGGKEGKLYLLDPSNLGGYRSIGQAPAGDTQILQWWQATGVANGTQAPLTPAPQSGSFHHIHGSPVFWHSAAGGDRVYVGAEADWLRAFAFDGKQFTTTPVDISVVTTPPAGMPGAMLTISADGDHDGILWASHPVTENANQAVVPGMIRALDAGNLAHELWNSTMKPTDDLGLAAKFTPPTVVNGRVYVATFSGKVCVYGLS